MGLPPKYSTLQCEAYSFTTSLTPAFHAFHAFHAHVGEDLDPRGGPQSSEILRQGTPRVFRRGLTLEPDRLSNIFRSVRCILSGRLRAPRMPNKAWFVRRFERSHRHGRSVEALGVRRCRAWVLESPDCPMSCPNPPRLLKTGRNPRETRIKVNAPLPAL